MRKWFILILIFSAFEGVDSFIPKLSKELIRFVPVKTQLSAKIPFRSIQKRIPFLFKRNASTTTKRSVIVSNPVENDNEILNTDHENEILRQRIRHLELENQRLHDSSSKIIIETFEREPTGKERQWFESSSSHLVSQENGITMSTEQLESPLWCDELDGDTCPVEPTISFLDAVKDRANWLVGLLILQSCSGFILSHNEELLDRHPMIIYFLTMLVGAGGNAGNQASVRVIRGLALGTLNERTQLQFLWRELKMAGVLCLILSVAGFLRAIAFSTPIPETIAVTSALALIVFSSICLGAILPIILQKVGIDPAHSSTTIQVIMDILGVVLTVLVSTTMLDTSWGQILVSRFSGN